MELENIKNEFGLIGVLMGGPSNERTISLRSGKAVSEALKSLNLDVVDLDIKDSDIDKVAKQIKKSRIDIAFIALHGAFGEDGTIQQLLSDNNIPYTGSGVAASKSSLNKITARNIMKQGGLLVPDALILKKDNFDITSIAEFPLVVKPVSSGSSIGLTIVETKEGIKSALDDAFKYDDQVLMEDYIEGRELTVSILDEKALSVIEIVPKRKFFDYQAKYTVGLTDYIIPAVLEKDVYGNVQESALAAHRALGCCGFSRVDMIMNSKNNLIILEVNTIPGMTRNSLLPRAAAAEGYDFAELCLKILKLAKKSCE
ncbi:MAG TPA: D-alanine--D-alanine ligase [Candidatus Omnitrophica bacterium]|nr:D-alanine--D-alanine ligase [Candidatus Omnitrophota bacterium]